MEVRKLTFESQFHKVIQLCLPYEDSKSRKIQSFRCTDYTDFLTSNLDAFKVLDTSMLYSAFSGCSLWRWLPEFIFIQRWEDFANVP